MNLAIDIGNTSIKYGVFSQNKLLTSGVVKDSDFSKLKEILASHKIVNIVYATVTEIPLELKVILNDFSSVIALQTDTLLPFQNKYLTPETLGKDRLANVWVALSLFPGRNVVVIDVGSVLK